MKNTDIFSHVRGESIYLDDVPLVAGTLFAAAFGSPHAHGVITKLDLTQALQMPGVVQILTYKDIPGENQIGGIVPDEPLLAEHHVHFQGMPVALVLAETEEAGQAALKKIIIEIDPLPIITDPRVAREKGELIVPPRTFRLGDPDAVWKDCAHIFEGIAETNGQEHLYIETQGAYSFPMENGGIRVISSTQGPTAVQRHMAQVLGVPMHQIEVDVTRLGGGFGGKEDQATMWAILCALGTYCSGKPVKYVLNRMEDMRMTGKRNPYSSDFKIGLDKDLKILAYEATFHQNAGATADLSPAVLERTLFHSTNTYFVPNVRSTAYSCRTNLPPNTAFRGFGGPQGMFVIEAAIHKAAQQLGIPAWEIQKRNLIQTGDEFSFGQKAVSEATECWAEAEAQFQSKEWIANIDRFNQENVLFKKGISFMPICFGISFTKTPMNQARALVHVYTDGSIGISTGAVEMGQGVNTKMLQVAQQIFSVEAKRIKIHSTNTFRIANTSPSAASATADLNGKAVEMAANAILTRFKTMAAEKFSVAENEIELRNEEVLVSGKSVGYSWLQLVQDGYLKRIAMSEHAHYAPPGLHFDMKLEKGHPFAYHVYGTAVTEVTVDCLRGTYEIDAVRIVHDFGSSMNPVIDRGQIEGGLVQGIGWMTLEEIVYDETGRLRSNALSTYKVPDIYSVPAEIDVRFLETEKDNMAILRSKAVGEPPLMYGMGTYFALRNAILAHRPSADIAYSAPMTPEKVLMALYEENVNVPVS
ncbi:MAG TPA: molybdopterin-dependent oxidoreductase [Catalimonadaceae bacterium]|nr:molybdopterin-dependent oxidoreductase [Catalimonadaceae bacterium]HPI12424.1 molybdopterin-dependent oxidoreductase [Catalimonadaceae bacterium]